MTMTIGYCKVLDTRYVCEEFDRLLPCPVAIGNRRVGWLTFLRAI